MLRKLVVQVGIVALAGLGGACGPSLNLQTLHPTDVFTGWYDFGVVNDNNKLVPSISFKLKNDGQVSASEVDLTVSFWRDGDDGEWDSKEVSAIGRTALSPGSVSDVILVRADVGYTSAAARADFFQNAIFRDATAKVFAKRDGKIVPLGEFKIDRRVVPHDSEIPG